MQSKQSEESKLGMEWVQRFYTKQNEWAGVYDGDIAESHRRNAATIQRLCGAESGTVLELGAGGGQNAVAGADMGHSVVAVELVASAVQNANRLAAQARNGHLTVVQGDFYEVELPDLFDIVCYWDGFGIGTDEDQRRLLKRIAGWLRPAGAVLIELYTPWFWARAAGRQMQLGKAMRRYDFSARDRRLIDRWWPLGDEAEAVSQSLRCYAPDEFKTLLEGTGLVLESVEPRGAFDFDKNQFFDSVPLGKAMRYLAKLVPESHLY